MEPRDTTLVWIDAREAIVARWHQGAATLERLTSDIPDHRRSTGHVRQRAVPGGGGVVPRTTGETHRQEHIARFIERVVAVLPEGDDLVLLGPGTLKLRLEHHVREGDARRGRARRVTTETAARLTERQLVARLRREAGAPPRRRAVAQGAAAVGD
jgi:hypothetical protein